MTPRVFLARLLARLDALIGRGLVTSVGGIVGVGLLLSLAAFFFLNTAAPRTLTITSGPPGSSFQRNAERYQKILARDGVTLKILPSDGSAENLRRLADPKREVDVGFVLGGESGETKYDSLVSLGAVAFQPLMLFHTGERRQLLSEFKGRRLNIGPEGSGVHRLALTLLKANGIAPGDGTTLDVTDPEDPGKELRAGRFDAIFLMGESTSLAVTRAMLHDQKLRLYDFVQADAYVRRNPTLNKLQLPRGALDVGKDIPAEDISLIGPPVQLVARESLHPALSDLLLEAAREVHGTPGLYRKRGEFPSPQEGEFRLSADASRYYSSGKGILYRTFPFWLASLVARVLAVLVPLLLLLVPALKFAPIVYRWHVESRIYRWYRVLLELEREAAGQAPDAERREDLLRRLEMIESAVNRIVVPAAFGDLFYALRTHIAFVRGNLAGTGNGGAAGAGDGGPC